MNALTVKFHGTELYAFRVGEIVLVAIKPIVEGMGLDWSAQFRRIQRDPILKEGIAMMAIPSKGGGQQQSVCLPLDLVHGWFFRIDSGRIKDQSIRERVLLYQRECYDVLAQHFLSGKQIATRSLEEIRLGIGLCQEARLIFGRRASAQLWRSRGLPMEPAMEEMFRQLDLFDNGA